MLDLEEQAAKGTGAEWATTLATTHANFVRSTSEVVLGALRQQLKSGGGLGGRAPPARQFVAATFRASRVLNVAATRRRDAQPRAAVDP